MTKGPHTGISDGDMSYSRGGRGNGENQRGR